MYFDAYLKGRNAPSSYLHPQGGISQVSTETASKFTMLRPPLQQGNPLPGKQHHAELRSDNYKPNTSAHIFLSAAKPANMPQRMASNYPARPQTGTAPLSAFSRHQLPEQQKYICQSPGKTGSRTSAGLVFEEIPQNRFDYRRSESITDMKPSSETFRDSSINYYPTNRPSNDHQDARSATVSPSPLELRFNPYADRRLARKEEGPLLTNREERPEPPAVKEPYSHKKIFKESYSDLFQNKPQIPSFDPNRFEYIPARADTADPKKYDFEGRKFEPEGRKAEGFKNLEESYKSSFPLQACELKKQSSQEFLKNYSVSKLPELDRSLDQDIEALRFASRKTDEILDREMNKNAYLNQLFEQKGLRAPFLDEKSEPKDTIKEKKEAAARNIAFERELEDKNRQLAERSREIAEKNREISQKSKMIVDKGRTIQGLTADLRQLQEQLARKDSRWAQAETAQRAQLSLLQRELSQDIVRITQLQQKIKESEDAARSRLQQKAKALEALQDNADQYKRRTEALESQLDNANRTILQQQGTISDMHSTIQAYESENGELRATNDSLRQNYESEKLQLIHLCKKEAADLKARFQADKQASDKAKEAGTSYLQAEIVELKQRNTLLEQDLSSLARRYKDLAQRYDNIEQQYLEIGSLLLLPEGFSHDKLSLRLRECLEGFARSEGVQRVEVQRVQVEQLERRQVELNRELKKASARLVGASMQAQQCGRLLRDANQEILLMHLINLNVKYGFLLENQ